jgi:hypothetical protein
MGGTCFVYFHSVNPFFQKIGGKIIRDPKDAGLSPAATFALHAWRVFAIANGSPLDGLHAKA